MSKVKVVAGVFLLLLLGGIATIDYQLKQLNTDIVKVVGTPPTTRDLSLPAYSGHHPSQLERPQETFSFPIKIGQIGPVEPLFSGPLQYPFSCSTRESELGQPIVDNHQGWGVPVYALGRQGEITSTIIGYSKDCLIPTTAHYFFRQQGTDDFLPLSLANNDIQQIVVNGKKMDFIVRLETGVINRFLYSIAVLKGTDETLAEPKNDNWNKKLIYQFRGGVGIGHRQGKIRPNVIFKRRADQLAQGYAVLYSSGTQTSNHYNLWRSEEVAIRVKRQFVSLYGEPEYTVGIGGSGGAIQQYLIAQNNPDVIDAIIAEYSYPDMVTQTLYAMDCELLEYYFDVIDRHNPRWQDWSKRQLIQGMNANANDSQYRWLQRLSQLREGVPPFIQSGETECVNGWRGLTPLVNNPHFFHKKKHFSDDVYSQVKWTHWQDLKHIYGTDERGYGRSFWDNEGVQYGLLSLRKGEISVDEFLQLNATIGGWKSPMEMEQERYWFLIKEGLFPLRVSVWSHHNMRLGSLEQPAKRSRGDRNAIAGAYRSGHIFLGKLDIPIIDVRHYLEEELDMHHLIASFATRSRMIKAQGHADNQLIWVTKKPHNPEPLAFEAIDQWMQNIRNFPDRGVVSNKPANIVDRCFSADGSVIAEGNHVWDGAWNGKDTTPGACSMIYQGFSVSRTLAGAAVNGDILVCHRQDIDTAMANGVYGEVDITPYRDQLKKIFPEGVCDYSLGDAGRPADIMNAMELAEKTAEQSPTGPAPIGQSPTQAQTPSDYARDKQVEISFEALSRETNVN